MRSSLINTRIMAALLALILVAGACGGDDSGSDDGDGAATTTTTEEQSATTTTEAGSDREEAIDDFQSDVRDDIGLGTGAGSGGGGTDPGGAGAADTYSSYVTVEDDSGILSVDVPAEWSDVDGGEGLFGPDVIASTDAQQFQADFSVPGVEFQATAVNNSGQDPADVLGSLTEGFVSLCTPGQIGPYTDPLYTGVSQIFTDCGGTSSSFVWVAVEPADDAFTAVVGVQVIGDRDIEALGKILGTFVVNV